MNRLSKTAAFAALALCSLSSALPVSILDNGPRDKRMNIVFLGDGYVQADSAKFISDAQWVLGLLMQNEPYRAYQGFFNASAVFRASQESGSDHPSDSTYVDTYYSSSYDTYDIARLVMLTGDGYSKMYAALAAEAPDYDLIIMIVNDPEYGGSGGSISVTSVNSSAPGICIHEMGHSFAALGDEYETAYDTWVNREYPNSTQYTARASIVWNPWIAAATPLPTPETSEYTDSVGLFEGCQYQSTGWYRPKQNCCMRNLNVAFCEVCRENHVYSFWGRVAPVDTFFPANAAPLALPAADTLRLAVAAKAVASLSIQWYRDGTPLPGMTGETLALPVAQIGRAMASLSVTVRDTTPWVRNVTKLPRQTQTIAWSVAVLESLPPTPFAPTDLGFSNITGTSITLGWTDNSANESGFVLFRDTANTRPGSPLCSLTANTASFTDTGLASGRAYFYWVAAFNDSGLSAADSGTASTRAGVPAAPTNLVFDSVTSTTLLLRWSDNATTESSYRIYRGTRKNPKPQVPAAFFPANTGSWQDTGLEAATTYYYWIEAFNESGASAALTGDQATLPYTGIARMVRAVPSVFSCSPNRPNPFNPSTTVEIGVPECGSRMVRLCVYSLSGKQVAILHAGLLPAGYHTFTWDGSEMASGVFVARMTAGKFRKNIVMTLMK